MTRRTIILTYFLCCTFMWGCESAGDCFKSKGERTEIEINVGDFTQVEINDYFIVTVEQNSEQRVILKAGKNMLSEIEAEVINGKLIIRNQNSCNWTRDLTPPELIISSPNLTEIRQNGGGLIRSEGTLTYSDMHLISEDISGDFNLDVNIERLKITSNSLTNYYISGSATNLVVGFFAGNGRFEGENLAAKYVGIFHRGTNEIIVHAKEALDGRVLSTGDLIYTKTDPPVKDVKLENRGRAIFKP